MTTAARSLPSIYNLDEIETVVSSAGFREELIGKIQDGFVALERSDFFSAPIQTLGLPPYRFSIHDNNDDDGGKYAAQTCIKTGYFKGRDYFVIKVASGGYPLENSGLMQIFSQRTGRLDALLLDNGLLTEIRTAAIGALSVRLLGPKNIETIGIVGSGAQARYQLDMLPTVTTCRNVLVWSRTPAKVTAFSSEMTTKGWNVRIAESPDNLLTQCEIIITTTSSREAILGTGDITIESKKGGILITCIGADAPGKNELHPSLVAKADLLVADIASQSVERGEFQNAAADGAIRPEDIVSLGELIEKKKDLYRKDQDDDRLIIFDSSGVSLQDCVISSLVIDKIGHT
jgi:ornithine cyclodeaminase